MKKKLLFVVPTLESGGAEKSLVNLLHNLDKRKYEVDVLIFKKTGIFLSMLPSEVNLIELKNNFPILGNKYKKVFWLLKKFKLDLFIKLFKLVLDKSDLKKNGRLWEQIMWNSIYREACLKHPNKYDIAVGYLQGVANYFVIDKVDATKKILWMHTDYITGGLDPNIDKPYFKFADNIVTVSEACLSSLINIFPEYENKFCVIQNISSKATILKQAFIEPGDEFSAYNGIKILTIAKPCYSKGIDIALHATKILKELGYDFKWFYIGRYSQKEYDDIMHNVSELKVNKEFKLLGEKINPYKYLSRATIYVHPSRLEGRSMAVDEAMLLAKPILVTNFPTAFQQIDNGLNGLIVESNAVSVANGIVNLLDNKLLRDSLVSYLEHNYKDNTSEAEKFNKLIN